MSGVKRLPLSDLEEWKQKAQRLDDAALMIATYHAQRNACPDCKGLRRVTVFRPTGRTEPCACCLSLPTVGEVLNAVYLTLTGKPK